MNDHRYFYSCLIGVKSFGRLLIISIASLFRFQSAISCFSALSGICPPITTKHLRLPLFAPLWIQQLDAQMLVHVGDREFAAANRTQLQTGAIEAGRGA
jgi:hypothetical protein